MASHLALKGVQRRTRDESCLLGLDGGLRRLHQLSSTLEGKGIVVRCCRVGGRSPRQAPPLHPKQQGCRRAQHVARFYAGCCMPPAANRGSVTPSSTLVCRDQLSTKLCKLQIAREQTGTIKTQVLGHRLMYWSLSH